MSFVVYVQNILFFLIGSNPPATQLILHNQLALAYYFGSPITNLFDITVNDLINARGVYLILGVQEGVFNRWEAFKRERHLFS